MLLKSGSRGSEVKQVQVALASKGFKLTSDGIFGKGTEEAVRSYQASIGLGVTGEVGDWLYKHLVGTSGKKGKTIAITAGHNNKDPGAVNGKHTESAIAIEFRNGVAKRLRDAGYTVLTDGEGTHNDILSNAVKLAKVADIAIEFHLNAAVAKTARGVEALSLDKDKALCKILCKGVSEVLDTPVRGSDQGWKSQSSGQHSRLAFCQAGGIIMEGFFISNDAELAKYFAKKEAVFDRIAKDIIGFVK